jgi:hypothetical protein
LVVIAAFVHLCSRPAMDTIPTHADLIELARELLEESERLCKIAEEAIRASMAITNAKDSSPSAADERSA